VIRVATDGSVDIDVVGDKIRKLAGSGNGPADEKSTPGA
jgi:hypothetical protein